jgi:hypothetical protein
MAIALPDKGEAQLRVDPFTPSRRVLYLALVLAFLGFLLPQEIPLVFQPVNEPVPEQLQLELTCSADRRGELQIYVVTFRDVNERDSIRIPLAPSTQPITYVFPLGDAPISAIRIDPPGNGASLVMTRLRLRSRAGQVFRDFKLRDVQPNPEIVRLAPTGTAGWTITTRENATDPFAMLRFGTPVVPQGMNTRNAHRIALSCTYLSVAIALALLALQFVFSRPRSARDFALRCAFIMAISMLFSITAHRGLIRESAAAAFFAARNVH